MKKPPRVYLIDFDAIVYGESPAWNVANHVHNVLERPQADR